MQHDYPAVLIQNFKLMRRKKIKYSDIRSGDIGFGITQINFNAQKLTALILSSNSAAVHRGVASIRGGKLYSRAITYVGVCFFKIVTNLGS